MSPPITTWTPERLGMLRRLIGVKRAPAEIAAAIGVTRAAASIASQKYLGLTLHGRKSARQPDKSRWSYQKNELDWSENIRLRIDAAEGSEKLRVLLEKHHPEGAARAPHGVGHATTLRALPDQVRPDKGATFLGV